MHHAASAATQATSGASPRPGLILVGFSPPAPLAAIARHLGWPGLVLSDPERVLYRRLGIGRAPLWRVYSPGCAAHDCWPSPPRRATLPLAGGADRPRPQPGHARTSKGETSANSRDRGN